MKRTQITRFLALISLITLNVPLIQAAEIAPPQPTYSWGLSERQGERSSMEDAVAVEPESDFFAVYDGHGGKQAADYAASNLHTTFFAKKTSGLSIEDTLTQAYEQTDQEIKAKWMSPGSTAITAYIDGNKLYFAWVGDARALVIRDGSIIFATEDHRPGNPIELERITNAGAATVRFIYTGLSEEERQKADPRIQLFPHQDVLEGEHIERIFARPLTATEIARGYMPNLDTIMPPRVLGDLSFKRLTTKEGIPPAIIATPDIQSVIIQPGDIILLGCDGVFDELSNEQVTQVVQQTIADPQEIASALGFREHATETNNGNNDLMKLIAKNVRNRAYEARSTDNISALVVRVNQFKVTKE